MTTCPYCGCQCYQLDEYGGIINKKKRPVVIVYDCVGCGSLHERYKVTGKIKQDDFHIVDCMEFINAN